MKKIFLLSTLCASLACMCGTASAQLLNENFTYTGNLTANGWTAHSGGGTNPIATTTGLTYTGYIGSGIGNAALIQDLGGEDDNLPLTDSVITNGTSVYVSFLVNVNDTSTNRSGDYFFHLGNRSTPTVFTNFAARVFARTVAGAVNFGISNLSTAGTMKYSPVNYATNATYLLILKYTINTSGADTVKMWVKASGVPASESAAGAPDAVADSSGQLGQDIIDAIALRQGSATTSVGLIVDGIRVDTTWAAVTGASSADVFSIGTGNVPGEAGHYTSLKAACDTLNARSGAGITKDMLFYITSNLTEPSNIALGPNTNGHTITFKPYIGVTPTITLTQVADNTKGLSGGWNIGVKSDTLASTINYGVTQSDSTEHIVIDGSNTTGGTTRDMTLATAAGISGNTNPIKIFGNSNFITVKNLNVTTGQSVSYAILLVPRNSTVVTPAGASGNFIPDNITIDNCNVTNTFGSAAQGIAISASGTPTVFPTGIIFRNNKITATTRGIFLNFAGDMDIYGNEINVNQTGNGSLSEGIYAFTVGSSTNVVNIYKNKFQQLSTANTTAGSLGIYGIYLGSVGIYNVYDNFITGFNLPNGFQGIATGIGILTGTTAGFTANIYNNSVFMRGDTTTAGATAPIHAAFYLNLIGTSGTRVVNVKDNIFATARTNYPSTAFYWADSNITTLSSNYNVLYTAGGSGSVGKFGTTIASALPNWKTISGKDSNSVSGDPKFISATDLHINPTASPVSSASNAGTPIATVATDIDGDLRSMTTPDIGADEFTPQTVLKGPVFTATPASIDFKTVLINKTAKDSVTVKNTGTDSLFVTKVVSTDSSFTVTPATTRLDTSASQKFFITFLPKAAGAKSAFIIFTDNTTKASDTVKVSGSGSASVTIAEARKDLNKDFIPDHSVTKDTLVVYGVITTPNLQGTQTSYFMQDSTGGINVFSFTPDPTTFAIGDSVFVIGTVAQFRGLTELTPLIADSAHFGRVKKNAVVPAPKHLTVQQFVANAESYEGQLVEVDTLYKSSGTWPASGANASIYVKNLIKADSMQLFLDLDTDIDGSVEPKYPLDVVGVVSQFSSATTVFNDGYELLPRALSDITPISVTSVATTPAGIPKTFELSDNFPNPFNPSTQIRYALPKQSLAKLVVYDMLGREVRTLVNGMLNAGYFETTWDGKTNAGVQAASGFYIYRMEAGSFVSSKKMMLLK